MRIQYLQPLPYFLLSSHVIKPQTFQDTFSEQPRKKNKKQKKEVSRPKIIIVKDSRAKKSNILHVLPYKVMKYKYVPVP